MRVTGASCYTSSRPGSLRLPYLRPHDSTSRFDARPDIILPSSSGGSSMLDIAFIALGLGGFALMGAYAVLCAKL